MATFLENFRSSNQLPPQKLELQGQPRGYVPANATVKGAPQTANFSPNALGYYINEYNNASDWNTKAAIVNAIMEAYPNPDESLKKWVNNLDKKTQEGAEQSRILSWAINEFNNSPSILGKDQVVNYLMERYPRPSGWLRGQIMKLNNIARQLQEYQDGINKGGAINELGEWK